MEDRVNYTVIPTNVVVHLGAPDQAARNVTVPFATYIKNVASNEIYPTWPDAAIEANILAIISFTLNRIYNEWYPSRGYDFNITSLPSYDQTFIEDKEYFDIISKKVDEIFNNYIYREGQVQPLYAVYCDGKVTKCNGQDVAKLSDVEGKGMCKNPEYVDYLKRCIKWRMENER